MLLPSITIQLKNPSTGADHGTLTVRCLRFSRSGGRLGGHMAVPGLVGRAVRFAFQFMVNLLVVASLLRS